MYARVEDRCCPASRSGIPTPDKACDAQPNRATRTIKHGDVICIPVYSHSRYNNIKMTQKHVATQHVIVVHA